MNLKSLIAGVVFLCLSISDSAAQSKSIVITRIGETSSFKGHSISLITTSGRKENAFLKFSAGLDTYGIISHKTISPGGKLSLTHNTILKNSYINDDIAYILYMGAGGVVGYLKDYYRETIKNHGVIMGVSTTLGGLVAFKKSNIELGLDFTADLALQLRKMEENENRLGLSWYANGLLRAIIPQISIYYRF